MVLYAHKGDIVFPKDMDKQPVHNIHQSCVVTIVYLWEAQLGVPYRVLQQSSEFQLEYLASTIASE